MRYSNNSNFLLDFIFPFLTSCSLVLCGTLVFSACDDEPTQDEVTKQHNVQSQYVQECATQSAARVRQWAQNYYPGDYQRFQYQQLNHTDHDVFLGGT